MPASAVQSSTPKIAFDTFTGIYHLSRDSHNRSLLTTEETILADFPTTGFTGITRSIPKTFQGHSVEIKILNVTDAAGDPIPYKTTSDNSADLVITTGDPTITLAGPQTIKLTYQTRGVVNLNAKSDELLLNVNGRGWDQGFNRVDATLYVAANFQAKLQNHLSCYLILDTSETSNCSIKAMAGKGAADAVITSRALSVAPQQALILKLDFQAATFTNNQASNWYWWLVPVAALMLLILVILVKLKQRSKTQREKP